MRNMVVLGGSFAPATKAHINILLHACKDLETKTGKPTRGLLCPASDKYVFRKLTRQKEPDALFYSNFNHFRYHILTALLNKFDLERKTIRYCTNELNNPYIYGQTLETLDQLAKEYPDTNLYFLMGADKIQHCKKWSTIETLLSRHRIAVLPRNGIDITTQIETLFPKHTDRFCILSMPEPDDTSSTKIRRLAKQNAFDKIAALSCDTAAEIIEDYMQKPEHYQQLLKQKG